MRCHEAGVHREPGPGHHHIKTTPKPSHSRICRLAAQYGAQKGITKLPGPSRKTTPTSESPYNSWEGAAWPKTTKLQ